MDVQTVQQKVREEGVLSGKEFLPSPEEIQRALLNPAGSQKRTAEEYLKKVESVMSSLRLQLLDNRLEYTDNDLVNRVSIVVILFVIEVLFDMFEYLTLFYDSFPIFHGLHIFSQNFLYCKSGCFFC